MENKKIINSFRDLRVYQKSFEVSMRIFHLTKSFPRDEIYSLTDQIRRSSRSVSGQIAESYRKRKYPKSFSSSLNGAEGEASETQNWLLYSEACGYANKETVAELFIDCENIIGMLVNMQKNAENWK